MRQEEKPRAEAATENRDKTPLREATVVIIPNCKCGRSVCVCVCAHLCSVIINNARNEVCG